MNPQALNHRRQRGAILIMTAAFIVAALALLALAVDTGRLYAAQTKLQSVTNLAALNAARAGGGCTAADGNTAQAVNQAIAATIDDNSDGGSSIAQTDASPTLGNKITQENLQNFTVNFTEVDPREADTVRVQLTRDAPTPLFALFSSPEPLTATAAATQTPIGGVSIGSRLAHVSTAQSALLNAVLGQMLGTDLDLSAVGYEGLANANLTLLDLIDANADVVTVDDLLSTELSTGELLQQIGDAIGIPNLGGGGGARIELGDLIHVHADSGSLGADVPINALGLVSALAQTSASQRGAVINIGSGLLDGLLGTLSLLPGVDISLGLELGVIEPPQYSSIGRPGYDDPAVGNFTTATGSTNELPEHDNLGARTWASTSSINLNLNAQASLNLLLVSLTLDLPLYLHIAPAYALLDQIECPTAQHREQRADIATTPGLLAAGLGHFDNVFDPNPGTTSGSEELLGLRVLGLNVVGLDLPSDDFTVRADSGEQTLPFDGPFVPQLTEPSDDNTRTVDSDVGASVGNLLGDVVGSISRYIIEAQPFTGLAGLVLNAVMAVLNLLGLGSLLDVVGQLLGNLLSALDLVLNPLLDLLGISVGSADITVQSVITNQPMLICTSENECAAITIN